jgi:lipoprotein-releasing system permease protein
MNGLSYWMLMAMLNRTPHVRLYNEVKPAENQPLDLSVDYKKQTLFDKTKDRENRYI